MKDADDEGIRLAKRVAALAGCSRREAELLIEKARAHLETEAETVRAMKEGRWDRSFIDALEARCPN